MKKPLVSILIPCYNSENYIEETLKSCLEQTWKSKEIIIVDDHSTDNSFEVLQRFKSCYPEVIKIFKNKKKGACSARNLAFEVSSGDFIQYLDADDLLNPEKIESQMRILVGKQEDAIAHCQWGRFYENVEDTVWKEQEIDKNYETPANWLVDSWNGNGMGQTSIWLTPRILIEEAGPWNEELKINQDGEFFSRVHIIIFCN